LRDLLIYLGENWPNFCVFYNDPAIPWINNITKQVIGRMKMRARTVRGYKTWPGMQTDSMLAGTNSIEFESTMAILFPQDFPQIRPPLMLQTPGAVTVTYLVGFEEKTSFL
jgi:hypothetical protein